MAGRTVDLAFRADLSQLVTQLKQLPGTTEAEAKKMASSLERQIKKAEKASVKAAKASSAAYKRQSGAMKGMGDEASRSAEKLKSLEDAGGETSSIMGGVASALDLVSPAAGGAVRALGDMSGGLEMVARSGLSLAGPLAALTAGVVIGTKVWEHYANKQKKVQAALEETKRKKLEIAAITNDLDADLIAQRHRQMVAEGIVTKQEVAEYKVRSDAFKKVDKQLTERLKARKDAQEVYNKALGEEQRRSKTLYKANAYLVSQYKKAQKARKDADLQLQIAASDYQALQDKVSKYGDTMADSMAKEYAAHAARKLSSGSAKEVETELAKLHRTTAALLPSEDLTKFEELAAHLELLETASKASDKAAQDLAPAIGQVKRAIADIQAKKAADEISELAEAARSLVTPETLTRMGELVQMQIKLGQAIKETGDQTGDLQATYDDLSEEIRTLQEQQTVTAREEGAKRTEAAKKEARETASAFMDAYGNINAAAAMVADEILARAESRAADETEAYEDQLSATEDQLADALAKRAELQERAKEENVRREMAATNAHISGLQAQSEADKADLAQSRELQGQAIRRAFVATQALKISEITMNTAAAMMQAAASVPTAALPFVQAGIATMGATQIALVGSQEPPSFHLGGIVGSRPDERMIAARAGEGVLTRQGVNAIGGESGLAAANRGQGGQALIVQHVYKHKILDEVLADSVARGGPIGGAINRRSPRGRRNPHGRRAG